MAEHEQNLVEAAVAKAIEQYEQTARRGTSGTTATPNQGNGQQPGPQQRGSGRTPPFTTAPTPPLPPARLQTGGVGRRGERQTPGRGRNGGKGPNALRPKAESIATTKAARRPSQNHNAQSHPQLVAASLGR
jgi:hypothetical protein